MKFFYPDGKIGYISKYNDRDDYQEIKQFYYNGKLKFEGEYVYGKNFGKEYDQNGKIRSSKRRRRAPHSGLCPG